MKNSSALKKDIILLYGSNEPVTESILQTLSDYFDDHSIVSRVSIRRGHVGPFHRYIKERIQQNAKLLVTADHYYNSKAIFKVLLANNAETRQGHFFRKKQKHYNLVINCDKKLTFEKIVDLIIVAWGCWYDGRKVTQPL